MWITGSRRSRSAFLLLVFIACCYVLQCKATHIDDTPVLPTTNITTPQETIDFSQLPFFLNCTGVGTLRWYQNNLDTPLDNMTTLNSDDVLTLNVSLVDSQSSFFCTSNNTLGTVRSRSIEPPFFSGFLTNVSDIDATIIARLSEAVAIECNIDPSITVPSIVWYKNNVLINPVPAKYNSLNNGRYLVIYDLEESDVTVNSVPVDYRCGVRGVVNPENSSIAFTINRETSIPDGYIVYRLPMNQIVSPSQNPVNFYYIGATNAASAAGTHANSVDVTNPAGDDFALLRVPISNNGVSRSGIIFRLFEDQAPIAATVITAGFTVVDPLYIIEVPTNDSSVPFHRFETESINFTCSANGTNISLYWYFNGSPLTVTTGDTLYLTNLSLTNAGVYQCVWNGYFTDDIGETIWALTVQTPVQPRGFVFTSTPLPLSGESATNRTIVPLGEPVILNLTLGADSLPSVSFTMSSSLITNDSITVDTTGNGTEFSVQGPTLLYDSNDLYWVSLTISNVTVNSSGFYAAVIDDSRTEPVSTSRWFISSYIQTEVVSFTVGPNNCLLASESSFLTCIIRSLPNATVDFRHNNIDLPRSSINTVIDPYTGYTNSTMIISNSMNDGTYNCRATSDSGGDNKNLQTQFCRAPSITGPPTFTSTVGDADVEINCTIDTAPVPTLSNFRWYFNSSTTPLSPSTKYDIRRDSDGNIHVFRLIISTVLATDGGVYMCVYNNTVIPALANRNISLIVNDLPTDPAALPWQYIGIGIGGGVIVALIVIVLLIMCLYLCVKSKKSGNYSTGRADKLTRDFTDGRGNVDQDSDEEEGGGGHEEPEAFQPQYESLPALRPAQPPQYKPSPSYNQGYGVGDDIEMMKVPIPDNDFDYPPGSVTGSYFPRHDNGGLPGSMGGGGQGSSMALQQHQPRYDDFMSDDGQFV